MRGSCNCAPPRACRGKATYVEVVDVLGAVVNDVCDYRIAVPLLYSPDGNLNVDVARSSINESSWDWKRNRVPRESLALAAGGDRGKGDKHNKEQRPEKSARPGHGYLRGKWQDTAVTTDTCQLKNSRTLLAP